MAIDTPNPKMPGPITPITLKPVRSRIGRFSGASALRSPLPLITTAKNR